MTGHQVNSLVADLVQMAKAMERVPQLETEITRLEQDVVNLNATKVDMFNDLEQSRRYVATLEQKCHNLEVQRDDAELRFLEADDAVLTLKATLRGVVAEATGALLAVGPQDEPEPELKGTKDAMLHDQEVQVASNVMEAVSVDAPLVNDGPFNDLAGQSEVDPTSYHPQPISNTTESSTPEHGGTETAVEHGNSASSSEGVSVPSDPTADGTKIEVQDTVSLGHVDLQTTAAFTETPPNPFVPPTSPSTSPSAPSSAAGIGDDEHIDYYGWHPANG